MYQASTLGVHHQPLGSDIHPAVGKPQLLQSPENEKRCNAVDTGQHQRKVVGGQTGHSLPGGFEGRYFHLLHSL